MRHDSRLLEALAAFVSGIVLGFALSGDYEGAYYVRILESERLTNAWRQKHAAQKVLAEGDSK